MENSRQERRPQARLRGLVAVAIVGGALALAGCRAGKAVQLSRDSDTVQCGPYSSPVINGVSTNLDVFAERELQECIDKYEAQGYRRNDLAAAPEAKP